MQLIGGDVMPNADTTDTVGDCLRQMENPDQRAREGLIEGLAHVRDRQIKKIGLDN